MYSSSLSQTDPTGGVRQREREIQSLGTSELEDRVGPVLGADGSALVVCFLQLLQGNGASLALSHTESMSA